MDKILIVVFKTVFFYFFVLIMYRIMGKREIAQLGVIDLIVSLLIAELIAISIEDVRSNVLIAVAPILSLVILELLLDYISLKSRRFQSIFEGKPSIIINAGKINFKEMVKQRYTIDNLLLELRQREIKSLEEVDYAFLETNGKLSIFKKKMFDKNYPMPIIIEGQVQEKTLKYIKKNREWLNNILLKSGEEMDDVFYAFYKDSKLFIVPK